MFCPSGHTGEEKLQPSNLIFPARQSDEDIVISLFVMEALGTSNVLFLDFEGAE